jgi:hypothetical protein
MVYGIKPKPTALKLREDFEQYAEGNRAELGRKNPNKPAVFAVAGIPGAIGKCLELRDGPDQMPAFEPHFFFDPAHLEGNTTVSFDLRIEPGYRFIHEWRDNSAPYRTSIQLNIENGRISAGGKKLAEFPALTWVHFEINSAVGKDATGAWDLRVTPAGGLPQTFEKLPSQKGGGIELRWLGFISSGTAAAKAWLDNLNIDHH